MLIWRNDHAQAFVFARDGSEHAGSRPAYGIGLKLDGTAVNRPTVRHFSVGIYGPTQKIGRGCWTWEAQTWRTDGHGAKAKRLSVKTFLRIKVGLGGTYPPPLPPRPPKDPLLDLAQRKNRLTRDMAEVKELDRVLKKAAKRQHAQQQKGPHVRRGLNGKALPNSRMSERGR